LFTTLTFDIPDNYKIYTQLIILFISFFITYFTVPIYIRKFRKKEFTVPDVYKNGTLIPTIGGFAILGGILVSLTFGIFIIENISTVLIFYFVVITFATFGILDDLVNVGRPLKIVAPFIMALPIALICQDTTMWFFGDSIDIGLLYPLVLAPLCIMIVSNLINMHSGYNGLQSGLSLIIIIFLTIFAIRTGALTEVYYILPLFGSLAAFYLYNKYPARIFEGNTGALAIGSAIGGYIILLNNAVVFSIILFMPHIINFLMYIYWKIMKIPHQKFGSRRADNTLEVPNPLTLKWVIPYYFKTTEKGATYQLYLATICFGIIGLIFI